MERLIKQNKMTLEFSMNQLRSCLTSLLEWFYLSSVSKVILNVMAKPSGFNMRVIKYTLNSVLVVEDEA